MNFAAAGHASVIREPLHTPLYNRVSAPQNDYSAFLGRLAAPERVCLVNIDWSKAEFRAIIMAMKISTKGRYALQVMVEFAAHDGDVLSLKSVAEAQNISLKYLEQIVQMLVKKGLLTSFRGANGGYKLSDRPDAITVAAILNATEGSLSVAPCMEKNACGNHCHCRARKCWDKLNDLIDEYLQNVTLAALLRD